MPEGKYRGDWVEFKWFGGMDVNDLELLRRYWLDLDVNGGRVHGIVLNSETHGGEYAPLQPPENPFK